MRNKILFMMVTTLLAYKVSTEEEYVKFPPKKGEKLLIFNNQNLYKRQSEKDISSSYHVIKPEYHDQEQYKEEDPVAKSRYDRDREYNQDEKYTYAYPRQENNLDRKYLDEKKYTYKQEVEEKLEGVPPPKSGQKIEEELEKLVPLKPKYDEGYNQEGNYRKEYSNLENTFNQQHLNEKTITYNQKIEEKQEKIPLPLYFDVNLKTEEPLYDLQQKKIDVNLKIDKEHLEKFRNQEEHYVSEFLNNYEGKSKKLQINVNIKKEKDVYSGQEQYDREYGPKNININVKISKVQEPEETKNCEVPDKRRESVFQKLYRVSKEYAGL